MAAVNDMWMDMRTASRFGLGVGVVLVIALAGVSVYWLTRDDYAVLFSDMEARDASGVVTELDRMKVSYRLADGGTRILVPESAVHEARLKLMGSGVPLAGGVGFEIFDNSDFGMTEFAQKVNFQRALQGELTRTVMSLKEVKNARVHLVLPESGLFKRKDSTPSASVTVFLNPGKPLSVAQISGIRRLVAAAVPELSPTSVTVADHTGVILSRPTPDGSGVQAMSERLQKKIEIETYLTEKVLDLLAGTFDPGDVLVSVDATLNFNQVRTTQEHVIPNAVGNLVRKRESRLGAGSSRNKSNGNVTTEVEYQMGREVAQIVEMPGEIMRLSIGVVLPPGVAPPRVAQIRELVGTSIGLDPTRGDAITVYSGESTILRSADGARGVSMSAPPAAAQAVSLDSLAGDGVRLRFAQSLVNSAEADYVENEITPGEPIVASDPGPVESDTLRQLLDPLLQKLERLPLPAGWSPRDALVVAAIVLLVLVILVFALVRAGLAGGRGSRGRITASEREQRLVALRTWLSEEHRVGERAETT